MFQSARRQSRGRPYLFTWLSLAMILLSLTPAAAFAATGQRADAAARTAQASQTLEIHVSTCPPGTDPASGSLYNLCHDNGADGVDIHITGAGIDQTKTTVRNNGTGPGAVNTGDIPAGDYTFAASIPGDMNAFSVYCSEADTDNRIPTTPNDASTATVSVPEGVNVVCDLYVIPQGGAPEGATLDLSVRTCDRADLPSDARAFDDLSANCTGMPAKPIEFTLGKPDGTQQKQSTDPKALDNAAGDVRFSGLPNGDYTIYSNVPRDEGADYLFCEYTGQPRYEKQFNDDGVTAFTNLLGEQIDCDWFVVYAAPETAPAPTTAPAEGAAPTATTVPTATTAPQSIAPQAAPQEASISVNLLTCPVDYDVAANGEDGATFAANCTQPTGNVLLTLSGTTGDPIEIATAGDGTALFSGLAPDTYTLATDVPLEFATGYLFCMADDGVEYQKDLDDQGVTTFQDVETEQIECAWYIVPESQRGDETGATVTVHLSTCPEDYNGNQIYQDCHGNGVADMDFTLTGPNGASTATTTIPADPGPGVATFTKLPAGDYTLAGGPPQDFGAVKLFCTDPATGAAVDATMEGGIAHISVAEQQSVLCDWYFVPENARGDVTPTPTPTQAPQQKAQILVTLFACDEGVATAGATFADLDAACDTPVNDIAVSLGIPGGTPLSAATGASGDGAVRFYDLRPGDYVMTPNLPADYANAAVYCQIGDGDVYQKTLQNGSTTFVNVDGEQIACSWFLTRVPKQPEKPAGPTGSITVREFLCEKDRGEIKDWERECVPGATGSAFTLTSSDGAVTRNAAPNDKGVLVFAELPDGYYDLKQDTGVWCKAAAERVDSRSRVIVQDGGNTDVFLYECNQVVNLPSTGSGPVDGADTAMLKEASVWLAALAVPILGAAIWQARRARTQPVPVRARSTTRPSSTDRPMRFR